MINEIEVTKIREPSGQKSGELFGTGGRHYKNNYHPNESSMDEIELHADDRKIGGNEEATRNLGNRFRSFDKRLALFVQKVRHASLSGDLVYCNFNVSPAPHDDMRLPKGVIDTEEMVA